LTDYFSSDYKFQFVRCIIFQCNTDPFWRTYIVSGNFMSRSYSWGHFQS